MIMQGERIALLTHFPSVSLCTLWYIFIIFPRKLDNSYARLPKKLFSILNPVPVQSPKLVILNHSLAASLGLDAQALQSKDGIAVLAGNRVPEGAAKLAQAYAGHQFGHFTMLGDGRALLIGEQITPSGEQFDIQLKGSGKTPYSRGGDGRAALGPMLREYIISEAMHALGIPTTRSLAVEEVIKRQAALIAKWQLVGFIHGVMNTDNMTLSGETIDYGPCAFMDTYDPAAVFSSIDTYGRYAYGNQPLIARWNLARFAETLLPLLEDNQSQAVKLAEDAVSDFDKLYHYNWLVLFGTSEFTQWYELWQIDKQQLVESSQKSH